VRESHSKNRRRQLSVAQFCVAILVALLISMAVGLLMGGLGAPRWAGMIVEGVIVIVSVALLLLYAPKRISRK
jgi:heme A synthase